jgi:chromosome segregation ATPase
MLSEEVSDEYSSEKKNSNKQDLEEIKKLNEQVSVLKTHNAMIERDLSEIFKTINHKSAEKELQARLELVYEQQRVIKDYENQILNLKNQNEYLEKKFDSLPNKIIPDLKQDDKSDIDPEKTPQLISQEKYDEELQIKSKIIHEQQSILDDYQNQVSKLKEENKLLQKNIEINKSKLIAATQIQSENNDNNAKMQDMIGKIKYYQEDNLRLSNEVVVLSNKLENTKQQLKQFEDNKAKLMHQMQNLNNIISENNIIDSPFGTSTQKNEYKPETDEKTPDDKKQIVQNKFENLAPTLKIDNEEMNLKVNNIFKK